MWEQPLHNAHEVESSYGKPSWATAVQFRRRCVETAYLPGVAGDGGEDPPHGAHMVGGFPGGRALSYPVRKTAPRAKRFTRSGG